MTEQYQFPAPLVDAFVHGDGDTFIGWQLFAPPRFPDEASLWQELGSDLGEYPAGVAPPEIAQFYENENGRPYLVRQLTGLLEGVSPQANGVGEALGGHPAKTIFTTDYHCALEEALDAAGQAHMVIVKPEDAVQWGIGALPLVKLRGDLAHPDTLLLTGAEYERFKYSESRIMNRLLSILSIGVTLFLGFDYTDPVFRLLAAIRRRSDAPAFNAFFLHFDTLPLVQNELKRQGFKLLDLSAQEELAGRQAALAEWLRCFNDEVTARKEEEARPARPTLPTKGGETAISNLPAHPGPLVGRKAEVDAAVKFLRQKRSPVVLEGPAGMGKGGLAKAIAHACYEQRLFDAYIWWNTDYETRHLGNLLEVIGRQLGHPLRSDYRDPEAIYQLLQQRRCLLVVNRVTRLRHPQIIDFLREMPGHSSVLLTTTSPLDMGVQLTIKPLSREESVELIRTRAAMLNCQSLLEADEEALEPLCEVAGGEPQALIMAVGLVKSANSLVSLSQLADEVLQDKHNTLYGAAYDSLTPVQKKLLNLIALSEESIALSALREIQRALGRPFSEEAIAQMIDTGLLRKWPTRHDTRLEPSSRLVRRYCQHYISTFLVDEEECLRTAMANYYVRQCEIHGHENWAGHEWLEENLTEIEAALNYYLQEAPPEWRPFLDLVESTYYFMGVRGYWSQRIHFGERALEGARSLADREWEANILVRVLGWTRVQLKEYERARHDIEAGLKIFKRLGDAGGMASAYRYLGTLQRRQQQYDEAESLYQEALTQAAEAADRERLRAGVLVSLGTFYFKQGRLEESERHLQDALAAFQEAGHQPKMAEVTSRLADVKYRLGDEEAAQALYEQSNETAGPVGRQKTLAYNYLGLARLARDKGAYTQAQIYAEEAQQLFGTLGIADEVQEVADLLQLLNLPEPEADEINPATGLPQGLLAQLLAALTASDQFQRHGQLRALFVASPLAPWWPGMPETFTLKNRALSTITYLLPKWSEQGENGLVLLLRQLQSLLPEEDAAYHRLGALTEQVAGVLTAQKERVA